MLLKYFVGCIVIFRLNSTVYSYNLYKNLHVGGNQLNLAIRKCVNTNSKLS